MSVLDNVLEGNPWLEDFVEGIGSSPEDGLFIDEIVLRLLGACAIGWMIGRVYQRTYTGRRFSPTLPDTHLLLCMGGALIWLVVGNNIVRAFGLAGTIGLIRYRTVVRDPQDTTILLFSMVTGMACGLGQLLVAFVGGAMVVVVLLFLHVSHRRLLKERSEQSDELLDLLEDGTKSGGPSPGTSRGAGRPRGGRPSGGRPSSRRPTSDAGPPADDPDEPEEPDEDDFLEDDDEAGPRV